MFFSTINYSYNNFMIEYDKIKNDQIRKKMIKKRI